MHAVCMPALCSVGCSTCLQDLADLMHCQDSLHRVRRFLWEGHETRDESMYARKTMSAGYGAGSNADTAFATQEEEFYL